MKIIRLLNVLAVACFALGSIETAQAQSVEKEEYGLFRKGVDLFEKRLYADAQEVFRRAAGDTNPDDLLTLSQIARYRALCAIELRQKNMEGLVYELMDNYPENKHANEVAFALADYFYREQNYKKAAHWFETVDSRALRYHRHVECTFKKGHSYFELGSYHKASNCFVEVKDVPNNPYSAPATYYYGHTEYKKKNYVSAQVAFEKIADDSRFATLASFYLVQIYYLYQEYDNVITFGDAFLDTNKEKEPTTAGTEVARLVSEAHFHLKDYDKAREYYNRYAAETPTVSRHDEYYIGTLETQTGNYAGAITAFNNVSKNRRDTLSQNALYQLGSVYLKQGDKNKAQNAFDLAARQTSVPDVTQDALLQYAKLSLELQQNGEPLKRYFDKYPDEARKSELRPYLASFHIATRDYQKALEELLRIPSPTDKQQADIQRLNFIIGKQLYDTRDTMQYGSAIHYFDASLYGARYNAQLEALARYYKADACFEMGYYGEAGKQYEAFVNGNGAFLTEGEYIAAHYNLGYCCFKLEQHESAISWFAKFINVAGERYNEQVADAYNCMGDCHFIQKKYWPAADCYNKSIERKGSKLDYSLFQKAACYGLLRRNQQKIETLNSLVSSMPTSAYAAQSLLEIGRVHLQENQYDEAEKSFADLVKRYPKSAFVPQAYLEMGLICSNTRRPEEAIGHYKNAVEHARPNSEDAKSAMVGLQDAYTDLNNLGDYYKYAQSVNMEHANRAEKEQALFLNAERLANSANCDRAIAAFGEFIEEFGTESKYLLQSRYYMANCLLETGKYREAVEAYTLLTDEPEYNIYKEQSFYKSSQAFAALGDYAAAADRLNRLVGQTTNRELQLDAYLRMAHIRFEQQKDYNAAADAAQWAIMTPGVTAAQTREMKHIKAICLDSLNNPAMAIDVYHEIIAEQVNDELNAEAMYRVIRYTFQQGSFEEGERLVDEFAQSSANSYQYWSARCFMELAEQYVKQGNVKQAQATYSSILKGYENKSDGIQAAIRKQLNSLK